MKKSFIKQISVLLGVMMLFAFTSCNCRPNEEKLPPAAEQLKIVTNGTSDYSIVVKGTMSECDEFAMKQLQEGILAATGAELRILSAEDVSFDRNSKHILLGQNPLTEAAGISLKEAEMNLDGFVIKFLGNTVAITGANERGTLFGVYEFLERYAGVRYIAYDCTYIPKLSELSVPKTDVTEIPDFKMRNFFSGEVYSDSLFESHSRFSSEFSDNHNIYGNSGSEWYDNRMHNTTELVDPLVYYDEHPEWFYRRKEYSYYIYEICFTNGLTNDGGVDETMDESVVKVFIEGLKKRILEKPEAKYFMIGQQDYSDLICDHQRCLEMSAQYGGRSGLNLLFMNCVTREINEWLALTDPNREVNIVTFAYLYTENPPVVKNADGTFRPVNDKVIPVDNLLVRIAPRYADYYHSLNNERQPEYYKNMLRGWETVTDKFMIWDYTCEYSDYLRYFPNFSSMKENLQYYKKIGAVYVMNQSSYDTVNDWQAMLKTYVSSKLLWDTEKEVQPLIEEFTLRYFGETAAPYINRYVDIMERHFAVLAQNEKYQLTDDNNVKTYYTEYYPKNLLLNTISMIQEAIDKTQANPRLSEKEKTDYVKRVTRVLLTPLRTAMVNYSAYYDPMTFTEFALNFFEKCEFAGLDVYRETKDINSLRKELGL